MYNFEIAKINENSTKEEIKAEIARLTHIEVDNKNMEQGLKTYINSIYGAIGNKYFIWHNKDVAEAVTMQGKSLILFSSKCIDNYFKKVWPNDTELHEKINVKLNGEKIENTLTVYIDTDSVDKSSMVNCENNIKINIEELFLQYAKINGIRSDNRGNEIVDNKNNMIEILNYDSNKKEIYKSKIKKLIRHKVTKPKWEIKSKSGKILTLTNDHSVIIFRNGKEIEIKPSEIKKGDKVLKVL